MGLTGGDLRSSSNKAKSTVQQHRTRLGKSKRLEYDRIAGYSVRRTTRCSPVFADEFRHNLFEQSATNSFQLLTYTLFITILSSLCQFKDSFKLQHCVSPDDSSEICDRKQECLDLRLLSRHLPQLEVLGKNHEIPQSQQQGFGLRLRVFFQKRFCQRCRGSRCLEMRKFKRTQRCCPGNDAVNAVGGGDQRCCRGMQQLEADDHAALLVARHREKSFLFQERLYHVLLVAVSSIEGRERAAANGSAARGNICVRDSRAAGSAARNRSCKKPLRTRDLPNTKQSTNHSTAKCLPRTMNATLLVETASLYNLKRSQSTIRMQAYLFFRFGIPADNRCQHYGLMHHICTVTKKNIGYCTSFPRRVISRGEKENTKQ